MIRINTALEVWKPRVLKPSGLSAAGMAFLVLLVCVIVEVPYAAWLSSLGDFEGQTDVGEIRIPGSVEFDPARREYTLTGSGANMWDATDAFHYVWRRVSGDVTLTTGLKVLGTEGNEHRKGGWVIRQSLGPSSVYVGGVIHGNGLTSVQYREREGDPTKEIRSALSAPQTIRLARRGDTFTMWNARSGEQLQEVGSVKVGLHDPVYIGLAACAHDAEAIVRVRFSHVSIERPQAASRENARIESNLEIISVDGRERRVVYRARHLFEAPNWSRDGKHLLFNSDGRIYIPSLSGGEPRSLDTGSATNCNNDHGLSPDGKLLAVSHAPKEQSLIYMLPSTGGEPRLVTPLGPSYWHGWSPDGRTLAYCAERGGNYDIYTIPVEGGAEKRMTNAPGLDDGPDYSPDGKYIYFNSERTGLMQIWRMKVDGSTQEQVTNDDYADWFPHPSPDGKWLVFLSYDKSVKGHPPNKHVMLRIMPLAGGKARVLAKLFGGQGTINVPSWSPDSERLVFVSYYLIEP